MSGERPTEGVVVVRSAGEGFAQEIAAGSHRFLSDEPARSGGTDTGPTPYDLLLASLGACTSMSVTIYARRKQWPLQRVIVRLRHSRVHAEDCEACETRTLGSRSSNETSRSREHWMRSNEVALGDRQPLSRTSNAVIADRYPDQTRIGLISYTGAGTDL